MATQAEVIIRDPLATARLYLQLNPNEAEKNAIRRLLATLADFEDSQPIRDVILFQGEPSELTAALLDARRVGRYTDEEWRLSTNL